MTRDPPAENERAYLRERQFHPSISTLLLFFTYSSKLIRLLPILPADGIDMKLRRIEFLPHHLDRFPVTQFKHQSEFIMCRLFDIKIDFDLANVFQKYLVVYSDLLIGIVVGGAGGTSRQSESTGE